jgi:myo-inositol-1(or 4)-monophosphatase
MREGSLTEPERTAEIMIQTYLDTAVEAAREAGQILVAELARPVSISYKGEVDIVTQADKRSEESIVTRLHSRFPRHAIIAEEGGGAENDSRWRWHVDPLDGTTNFAHGYPCFCVSIGLEEEGELIVGVIYQPVSGELFTAAKGQGAYLNNKRIQVSRVPTLGTGLMATGFPSKKRAHSQNINFYWEYTLRSHGVRRDGSAALDLAAVACGRFDGFWEFGLHSWDTAAGVLLVREAGGMVTTFSGEPYCVDHLETVASNSLIHEEMLQIGSQVPERISGLSK